MSIPYHGCAVNITVQSYLDQLDFGLIACSETVPDAQRIVDFIVEDFAAMGKADATLDRREAIETIYRCKQRPGRSAQADPARRAKRSKRPSRKAKGERAGLAKSRR